MQIHPDDLPSLVRFTHRGLLESVDVSTPSMSRGSPGAEAPLHRIRVSVSSASGLPLKGFECGFESHRGHSRRSREEVTGDLPPMMAGTRYPERSKVKPNSPGGTAGSGGGTGP